MKVQRLFIYPIKSLLPVEIETATITNTGFLFDRQFILIDESKVGENGIAEHLTIKTTSELCLFHQSINQNMAELTITWRLGKVFDSITVSLTPLAAQLAQADAFKVDIFGSQVEGRDVGLKPQKFFSAHLGRSVRLLYIGEGGSRDIPARSLIPRKRSKLPWLLSDQIHSQKIRSADAAPLLITTTASEQDARSRLPKAAQSEDIITRFRPNIHIDTEHESSSFDEKYDSHHIFPYVEDTWKRISIHPQSRTHGSTTSDSAAFPVFLDCVFRTVRCQSINVDFDTGKIVPPERQLYRLLTKDRRVNHMFPAKPCFGTYCFAEPDGVIIRVGDKIRVEEKQES